MLDINPIVIISVKKVADKLSNRALAHLNISMQQNQDPSKNENFDYEIVKHLFTLNDGKIAHNDVKDALSSIAVDRLGFYQLKDIDSVSNNEYYGGQEPPFTMKSLSEDFENDFLKKNTQIESFRGGNGVWTIKINRNYNEFVKEANDYAKSRIYMRIKNIELISNASGRVLVELL